ncbi:alpha-galactosidase [Arthrobacter sp. SDTb3-6]|uniref:alpha-galactosidase n=1 Tax=Arthrobacter sp. SDTb3-6 TaxID=2713571 RepID=UPI00159DFE58|nr:alpha-galactosidase [Arthrobacter sp. SDTb3-6]
MPAIYLRQGRTSLVIGLDGGAPQLLHWGADLGPELPDLAILGDAVPHSALDVPVPLGLVPQASDGWRGRPGLRGHGTGASGAGFSPRLRLEDWSQSGGEARIEQLDADLGLAVMTTVTLHAGGLLEVSHGVENRGGADFALDGLAVTLPAGRDATEILDLTGRWCRERHPQRRPVGQGTWVRSGRHGRTGHDASLLLAVGTPGFGNRHGKVWAAHLGWSGDHEQFVDTVADGRTVMGAEELLGSGEVVLAPGESYVTPPCFAAYSDRGLDGISEAFHHWFRARSRHPSTPRPVVLNVWEAVYFDHRLDVLTELAESAAELGVERFVLDDGWFHHRRNDSAGLGDWYVDGDVWPQGLHPLVEAVTSRGMQFGLWVEPEMANVDSDVARAHPDWIAGPVARHDAGSRLPLPWRHQQVLDLANPDAWQYIFDRLNALLDEYPISYLKWDQNRDLAEMGHDGRPGVHRQTLAVYRLLDALKAAHPGLEIESCSSGGARVDLGILERTDRIWASDCNDALERQTIQRWTSVVVPPELVGSHIGPGTSHTTGRTHDLSFRAATALFGHFGMEWDIRGVAGAGREELRGAVELYKKHRGLIHSGTMVRADVPDPSLMLHGVVAGDGTRALFALVAVATSYAEQPGRVAIPGLDPELQYRVALCYPGPDAAGATFMQAAAPAWLAGGAVASGRFLAEVGLPMPVLNPEHAILLEVTAR